MQWRTTDETLSHGRTCSLLLVFTLRDKPVVFGTLGRVADGNRELRHAWASSKPPALVLYLATMQSLWLGSRRMCKIKVLPSLPCGLFGVSSKVQMKMYGLLCIFVPGRTKKTLIIWRFWIYTWKNVKYVSGVFTRFVKWIREGLRETSAALLRPRYAGRYSQRTTREETPCQREATRHISHSKWPCQTVSGMWQNQNKPFGSWGRLTLKMQTHIPALLHTGMMRLALPVTASVHAEINAVSDASLYYLMWYDWTCRMKWYRYLRLE